MLSNLLYILTWPFSLLKKIGISNIIERAYNSFYSGVLLHFLKSKTYVHFQSPVDLIGGENIIVGNNTYFGHHLVLNAWEWNQKIKKKPFISIGNGCSFQPYNHISCINRIEIGNGVLTGRWVTICDNNHGDTTLESMELPPLKRPMTSNGPIIIEDNVWIGDKVTVLGGVTIGRNAIIGSNSVVTKNIPPYCVAAGIPAKVIKSVKSKERDNQEDER